MQTFAIDALQRASASWLWPALLHSVWIGLLSASICALTIQAATRLSHRARYAILLGSLALATVGPVAAAIVERTIALASVAASNRTPQWLTAIPSGRDAARLIKAEAQSSKRAKTDFVPPRSDPGRFAAESFANIATLASRVRPFVLTAWYFGVAVIASYLLLGARTVRRMRREAEPAPPETRAMCGALAKRLGIRRAPCVLVHPRVGEPFLCGIVRTAIVLPGFWEPTVSSIFTPGDPGT